MKRLQFKCALGIFLLSFAFVPTLAYDFEVDGIYYNITSMSDLEVGVTHNSQTSRFDIYPNTSYNGFVNIPSTVNYNNRSFTVTSVLPYAMGSEHTGCNVTSVSLPNTIKTIGEYAFYKCQNLNECNLPQSLISIDLCAFSRTALNKVVIPENVITIGLSAFSYCTSLTSIIIGKNVRTISSRAFQYSSSLLEVFFTGESVPDIGTDVFRETSPYLEKYVPSVEVYGFGREYISFMTKSFDYSGQTNVVEWNNNLKAYKCEINQSECLTEINSGKYTKYLTAVYSNGLDLTVKIPYDYVINKVPLSVIVSDAQREYGETNPDFCCNIYGFVNGENEQTLGITPLFECNATKLSKVGNYPISTAFDVPNYDITFTNGILSIVKAPLSVNVVNSSKIYGSKNPAFVLSFSGLKNNESNPEWSKAPNIKTEATEKSNVGQYVVTASDGIAVNYEITGYTPATLTITKKDLNVKANDCERYYGEENPIYKNSYIGFANEDTEESLSIIPTPVCNATKSSNVGTYNIYVSGGESNNYNFIYKGGTLTIKPRNITVSIGNYTKTYGTDNPIFQVQYDGFVNNENESVLTEKVNVNCTANKTSDTGVYPITISGGSATNYIFSKYNFGTLTIEKAEQTLTWNQDLSNIQLNTQVALEATSSAGLPVTYEMSPNNVATLYESNGMWYLDCFGSGAVNINAVQDGDKNHNPASKLSKTLVVNGGGVDPSNPQIFVNIENAGTLSSLIAENRKYQIKNLRLTGYLNGTDINFLREMAGCDSYGNTTPGILETLDISECSIVSGGRSYYGSYQTSSNKVGDYMFYNCKVLVNLMLPDYITTIGNYAFADCDRLSVISIPNNVNSIGEQSFRNDLSILRIQMPKNLTTIGNYAFMGCNGLTEITLPASVSYIGDVIVKDCQNISRINVEEGNANFASDNGVLYTSSFDKLLLFPVNYNSSAYSILNGTTGIAPYAFVNANKLTEVVLPSSMLTIGRNAFIGCINLSSLQVKALIPPVCDNYCFDAVSKTRCELKVPNGCYSYYWVAPIWSDFNKIVEYDFSNIVDNISNNINVFAEGFNIIVSGLSQNTLVRIFQINGTQIYQTQSDGNDIIYRPISKGTYIVVINNKSFKILVK